VEEADWGGSARVPIRPLRAFIYAALPHGHHAVGEPPQEYRLRHRTLLRRCWGAEHLAPTSSMTPPQSHDEQQVA